MAETVNTGTKKDINFINCV